MLKSSNGVPVLGPVPAGSRVGALAVRPLVVLDRRLAAPRRRVGLVQASSVFRSVPSGAAASCAAPRCSVLRRLPSIAVLVDGVPIAEVARGQDAWAHNLRRFFLRGLATHAGHRIGPCRPRHAGIGANVY